jgi:hypothetical protein
VGITTSCEAGFPKKGAVVSNLVPATGISSRFSANGGTALMIQLRKWGLCWRFTTYLRPGAG